MMGSHAWLISDPISQEEGCIPAGLETATEGTGAGTKAEKGPGMGVPAWKVLHQYNRFPHA